MPSTASPRATSVSAARTLSAIANFGSAACQAPSFSSAALAYLPTGTDFDVAGGDLAVAGELGEIEALVRSSTLSILESFGAISTMLLPSRLTRVGSLMFFLPIA